MLDSGLNNELAKNDEGVNFEESSDFEEEHKDMEY